LNTRLKTPLAAANRYLIYKHITFLRHKVIRALPNATVFCAVVVIITLKTILNEKVGYQLPGDPIIVATTKSSFIRNINWIINFEYFYQKLLQSLEKRKRPPG